jgi:hypothetical protein
LRKKPVSEPTAEGLAAVVVDFPFALKTFEADGVWCACRIRTGSDCSYLSACGKKGLLKRYGIEYDERYVRD